MCETVNVEVALAVVVLLLKNLPQLEEMEDWKRRHCGIAVQHGWT